jgi:hypothetical protein
MAYLFFNVPVAKCIRFTDAGGEAEYYFTYQAYYDLDANTMQLSQGFSLGCPVDDGYAFSPGVIRALNDPKFLMKLPELQENQSNVITLDLFLWESDHSTEDTKKMFSNVAAQKLQQVYSDAQQVKKKAQDDFLSWFNEQGMGMLGQVASSLGGAAAGAAFVGVTKQLVPLLEWGIQLVKSNSDDYIGMIRTELLYKKVNGAYQYRWVLNGGAPRNWTHAEEAPLEMVTRITEASADNIVDAHTLMQILLDGDAKPIVDLQKELADKKDPLASLQLADDKLRSIKPTLLA